MFVIYQVWGMADPKPWAVDDLLLASFVGCLLLNLLLNLLLKPVESTEANPLSLWVFYFFSTAVLYWIARQSKLTPTGIAGMTASFMVLGVYLGLTAIAEKKGWRALVFPRYIMDPAYEESLGRGRGPLLNPIGNGLFLTIGFVSSIYGGRNCKREAERCWPLPSS
jgi:hypothetical protein